MNLALDFGNTRVKAGVFSGENIIATAAPDSLAGLKNFIDGFKEIKNCIIGSVTNGHEEISAWLSAKFNVLQFNSTTPTPLKNLYHSISTLGSDRLAASVGAYTFSPFKNVLTIDAGTCIKYNFVNADNEYLGGAIAPGLSMRLKAMHEYTHRLPLVEADSEFDKLTGSDTRESLLAGALTAAACEVQGMTGRYEEQYGNLVVYITGGDSAYLCKLLKNRFFANQNLLLIGLNAILNFNLEK